MRRDDELAQMVWRLQKQIDDFPRPERAYGFVPLTTPYTNAAFDGDSFSDVAANTIIDNASWSTTIPANAVALLIWARARDSGSGGTNGLYLWLYGANAGNPAITLYLNGAPNDTYVSQTAVMPCTDGDIWYQINASGASTMDVWLQVHGYWV